MKNLEYEKKLLDQGIELIAGVDEVGRGCLAGPMVIGAVILSSKDLKELIEHLFKPTKLESWATLPGRNNDITNLKNKPLNKYTQINDSKLLTAIKRSEINDFVQKVSISYSIEIIDAKTIDRLGIAKCTQLGFYNAIQKLKIKPQYILTDAFKIKRLSQKRQENIVKGDQKSITIAAASIIAKVFRDNLMTELHKNNEDLKRYRFDQHKGYGTKVHLEALQKHGPCNFHRFSFEPVKSWGSRL